MEAYVSYYVFFSENLKLIKDVRADFEAEDFTGFDKAYGTFINKFTTRCHNFASNTLRGSSKVISNYISEVGETKTIPQSQRFDTLSKITEKYMRKVM